VRPNLQLEILTTKNAIKLYDLFKTGFQDLGFCHCDRIANSPPTNTAMLHTFWSSTAPIACISFTV